MMVVFLQDKSRWLPQQTSEMYVLLVHLICEEKKVIIFSVTTLPIFSNPNPHDTQSLPIVHLNTEPLIRSGYEALLVPALQEDVQG